MFQALRAYARPKAFPVLPLRSGTRSALRLPRHFSSSQRQNAYVRFGQQSSQTPQGWVKKPGSNPRVQLAGVVLAGGIVYYVSHLEQVPDTGRWRFMNTSTKREAQVGELLRQQTREELGDSILPPNHPLTRHVHRVVSRILHSSNLGTIRGEAKPNILSRFGLSMDSQGGMWSQDVDAGAAETPGAAYGPQKEWDVIVVNDKKMVNAMASPGLVVVFTGILPVCQDEEGLAAVLGHEIGHVVARHTAERLSSSSVLLGITAILAILGLDIGISNLITTYTLELPNSRTQEREADLIGLRLMSRACYDPAAAPQMFARLAKVEQKFAASINMDFLRTHPSSESRVKLLEDRLDEGYSILAANPECANTRQQFEEFKRTSRELKITNSGIEFA
ncbi:peptidase family M48-domain-containing protein [Crepidotus variabilis]|uniref:Peptidase family M48-domain-containing protein n=1 Tax=Crepidotus variabilis TaxID=179855 RepID=A0A9P6E8J6_9AGAR|nr:peptidase family M48-domain-containing protein [Crepidotus variabilis]